MTGGLKPPPRDQEEEVQLASQQKAIFVLEEACLEVGKVGKVGLVTHLGQQRSSLLGAADKPYTPQSYVDNAFIGLSTSQLRRPRKLFAEAWEGSGFISTRHLPPGKFLGFDCSSNHLARLRWFVS